MTTPSTIARWTSWRDWRPHRLERPSLVLVALGVLLPVLALVQPPQPLRALAAAVVLLALPGVAVSRLMRLGDPYLFALVTVSTSLALDVLVSTVLMYAGVWSWQLVLVLLGHLTVAAVAVTAVTDGHPS